MKDNTTKLTSAQEEIKSGQIERFKTMGLGKSKEREEVALSGNDKLVELKKMLEALEEKNKENKKRFEELEQKNEDIKNELSILEKTYSSLSTSPSENTKGKKRKRNPAGTPMPSHDDLFQLEQATASLGFRSIAPRIGVNNGLLHHVPNAVAENQSTLPPAMKKTRPG